jgi:hypothetical protein
MKKKIYIGLAFVLLLTFIWFQYERLKAVREERNLYRQDTYSLLKDIEHYRVMDSIGVASISELCLTVDEYKKYRQADMKLIESLKVDRKRLQQVIASQMQSVYELQGTVRDSIVYRDNYIRDTLRCVAINEKWFDLSGCIDAGAKFTGRFENRDSLLYVEHVIPKRFWFIKWGVKERRQEIVSRNPHTKITGAEFVTVRK